MDSRSTSRVPSFVSLWGILKHVGAFMISPLSDTSYANPNFKAPLASDDINKGIAIYFVPGTADRQGAFYSLISKLIKLIPDSISAIHLPLFSQRLQGLGIDDFAEQLKEKIQTNNDKHVILAGHSRGGLVCAYFSEYLAKTAGIKVHAIFPIASPFKGSDLAPNEIIKFFGIDKHSKSIAQMQPGSSFLNDLNEKILISETPYFYYGALEDGIVKAESAHTLDDTSKTYDRHGHLSITFSQRLADDINRHLVDIHHALFEQETAARLEPSFNK